MKVMLKISFSAHLRGFNSTTHNTPARRHRSKTPDSTQTDRQNSLPAHPIYPHFRLPEQDQQPLKLFQTSRSAAVASVSTTTPTSTSLHHHTRRNPYRHYHDDDAAAGSTTQQPGRSAGQGSGREKALYTGLVHVPVRASGSASVPIAASTTTPFVESGLVKRFRSARPSDGSRLVRSWLGCDSRGACRWEKARGYRR